MPRAATLSRPFVVGDRVVIQIGPTSTLIAEITEDRGLIGHSRRQYFHVRSADPDWSEQSSFDVPADVLRHAPARRSRAADRR